MQPISINCPYCNYPLKYWTKNNFIKCPKCNDKIPIEPCEEPLSHEIPEEETLEELEEGLEEGQMP